MIFEVIGNVFLSKYILLKTIDDTINFGDIFRDKELTSKGYISLGSALMSSALIMMNVTIFALPMSSTHIMFSGLAGVTLMAFRDSNQLFKLVKTQWLIIEMLIWILTPIISMGLTYAMYLVLQKQIYERKDARKRVIKFIPYQVSLSFTLMFSVLIIKQFIDENLTTVLIVMFLVPFLIFLITIFAIRFYMIWQANAFDRHFSFLTIFLNCLKFW